MSVLSTLALIFTVFASIFIVSVIILLGWYLIWKTFLSKFRLVRELLGQTDKEEKPYANVDSTIYSVQNKTKKLRKD